MGDYSIEQRLFYLNLLLNEEEALNNYKNNEPFKFNRKVPFDISWDQIFLLLDEDIRNDVNTNQIYYNGKGFKIRKADRINEISLFVDQLELLFEKSKNTKKRPSDMHQIYITFTTDESINSNIHDDNDAVFFWQVRGQSIWHIYKEEALSKDLKDITEDDISHTFHLDVGDLIYCPKYRRHSVITVKPRAGVSLGFQKLKQ